MPVIPRIEGPYYAHGLTYKIAQLERMAVTHAYSMHHYGSSFMDPYTISGEYPGDLAVKLLNRAYMIFAASARHHFISTVYFYFPTSPFSGDNTCITLPLGNLRVLRSVGVAEARRVDLQYNVSISVGEPVQWVYPLTVEQAIAANVAYGSLSVGDTLVHISNRTFIVQRGNSPKARYSANVGPHGDVSEVINPFAYYPGWRVAPSAWRRGGLYVGTQASTVTQAVPSVLLSDAIIDYMARIIPTPIVNNLSAWNRLIVDDTLVGVPPDQQPFHDLYPYTVDCGEYVSAAFSNTFFNNFIAFSGPLVPFEGEVSVLTGGRLTLKKPATALPGSFVIAVRGEVEFRPAITLDRCDPYQVDIAQQDPFLRRPRYPASAPSSNKLAPMMLYPIPNYEHLGFLERYHVAVAQAMFLSHLSPDDSRYAGEQEILNNFIAAMAKEPDKEFRQRYSYPTDLATGNNVIRTG